MIGHATDTSGYSDSVDTGRYRLHMPQHTQITALDEYFSDARLFYALTHTHPATRANVSPRSAHIMATLPINSPNQS